jgi:hypothetical protein
MEKSRNNRTTFSRLINGADDRSTTPTLLHIGVPHHDHVLVQVHSLQIIPFFLVHGNFSKAHLLRRNFHGNKNEISQLNWDWINLCKVMNAGELEQCGDAVEETHQKKPIKRSCIAHFRQVPPTVQTDRGKCQHGCYAFLKEKILNLILH